MTELAKIDNFSLTPESDVNGAVNEYTFTVGTKVAIVDGDVFRFTFPPEIGLPDSSDGLGIIAVDRVVNDVKVTDELKAELAG